MQQRRQGPNQKCACGSGKKFKKCHGSPTWDYKAGKLAMSVQKNQSEQVPSNQIARNWLMNVLSHNPRNLELLMKAVQDPPLKTIRSGNDFYLDWEGIRRRMDFSTASHAAERFLLIINGVMSLRFPAYGNVTLNGLLGTTDEGKPYPISWTNFVVHTGKQEDQVQDFLKNGGPTIGGWHALANREPAISEAILYFGHGGDPFFDLYKTFEVIRDTVGGEPNIISMGLATSGECDRFTQTANNPELSGVFAKHSKGEPARTISNPMDPLAAREFIRGLLINWIATFT